MAPLHRVRRSLAFAILAAAHAASPAAAQDSTGARARSPVDIHGFLEIYFRVGDPTIRDGFRVRKADLKFSGDLSPRIRWRISFDAAKMLAVTKTASTPVDSLALRDVAIDQRSRMLQDAALTYRASRGFAIDAGQQIVPLGLEGTISTWNVETVERTLFIVERSRGVGLGDVRDVGVSANGRFDAFEYHVGMFNGAGDSQGSTDSNDQKAVIGRFAVYPGELPGFQFGASGGFEGGPYSQRRERASGEAQYRNEQLTIRGEVMSARDGGLHRLGWYGLGAVRPTARLQLVARVDEWDRDRAHESSLNDALQRQITGGASYLIEGGVGKIALNVVRQTFPHTGNVPAGTFVLAAFEAVW